jgi:hypothetical protein
LRDNVKKTCCRALTNAKLYILKREHLLEILDRYPKIKYYAKRWTQWELVRKYIYTYANLYYRATKRGAKMDPPVISLRPNLDDGDFDDIDVAVLGFSCFILFRFY